MHYELYVVHHTVVTVLLNCCYELMKFWSCMLANLRNHKSSSCADNGSTTMHICTEGLQMLLLSKLP